MKGRKKQRWARRKNLREKLEKRLSADLKINRLSEKMCATKMRVEDELRTFRGASESYERVFNDVCRDKNQPARHKILLTFLKRVFIVSTFESIVATRLRVVEMRRDVGALVAFNGAPAISGYRC